MDVGQNKYKKNIELICKAQANDDAESNAAVEEIIKLNMGLVRSIAFKFRDRGTEFDDLIQIGTIGMIKAIRTFDIEKANSFSTYAVPLIIGEIKRHIRDEGLIKVSRYQKKLGMELTNLKNRMVAESGEEPHIEALAAGCRVSVQEAAMALEAISPVSSLSESSFGDENITLESRLASDDNEIDILDDRISLAQSILKMQPMWRKIVLLRYYRNLTQQQTADIMGLSQVKISREEHKIIEFLRSEMAN